MIVDWTSDRIEGREHSARSFADPRPPPPVGNFMKELLLGIDVGTFSSKAALVTPAGEVLRTAVVPHGISTPAPGHVEQDADAIWWHDVCALCRRLLDGAPWRGDDVAAVAVSAI